LQKPEPNQFFERGIRAALKYCVSATLLLKQEFKLSKFYIYNTYIPLVISTVCLIPYLFCITNTNDHKKRGSILNGPIWAPHVLDAHSDAHHTGIIRSGSLPCDIFPFYRSASLSSVYGLSPNGQLRFDTGRNV
jgi:hypothetical protein